MTSHGCYQDGSQCSSNQLRTCELGFMFTLTPHGLQNLKFKFQETLILVGNTRVPCLTLPYYNRDQCLFVVDNTLSIGVYNFVLWGRSCYMKIVFETSLFNWHHKTVIRNCADKPYKTMDFIRNTCSRNSYRRNVLLLSVVYTTGNGPWRPLRQNNCRFCW